MPNKSRIMLNKKEHFKLCICFENIVYVYVCAHEMTSSLIIKSSHCIKVTFKALLKWKSAWNESCRSWKTKQKWYSKVFRLRPRRGWKVEFTELNLELGFNYKIATDHLTFLPHGAVPTPAGWKRKSPPVSLDAAPSLLPGHQSWPHGRVTRALDRWNARPAAPSCAIAIAPRRWRPYGRMDHLQAAFA